MPFIPGFSLAGNSHTSEMNMQRLARNHGLRVQIELGYAAGESAFVQKGAGDGVKYGKPQARGWGQGMVLSTSPGFSTKLWYIQEFSIWTWPSRVTSGYICQGRRTEHILYKHIWTWFITFKDLCPLDLYFTLALGHTNAKGRPRPANFLPLLLPTRGKYATISSV